MNDLIFDRCHWHIEQDGRISIYGGKSQLLVLQLTTEQKACLARDLAQQVAREVGQAAYQKRGAGQ